MPIQGGQKITILVVYFSKTSKGLLKQYINMLANCLRELQCAMRFIVTTFPIHSQWETGPQYDADLLPQSPIRGTNTPSLIHWLQGSLTVVGAFTNDIFMRDCFVHITITVVYW